MGIGAAVVMGVGLPRLDAYLHDEFYDGTTQWLFGGGAEAARTMLSVIAGSLITVTSLIFSLTVVTLQLASSQYSPRLLRNFARDRTVQTTLALLLGTFMYAVTVLRTVRSPEGGQAAFVPRLAVTMAVVLVLASVITLVLFTAHVVREIRVESILRDVHGEASATLRRVLREQEDEQGLGREPAQETAAAPTTVAVPPPAGGAPLCASTSGFLLSVDGRALLKAAVDADAVLLLDRLPGDFLIAGTPIGTVWAIDQDARLSRRAITALEDAAADAIRIGFERTPEQDPAFGLRQIVDVAIKAISPSINDPTTAVHALGRASAVLCEAASGDLGPRRLCDKDGRTRVTLRRPDLPLLLELAVGQPRRYGAGEPDVLARLFMLLREVAWSTRRPEHRSAVTDQLERLRATVRGQRHDRAERARMDELAWSVQEAVAGRWPLSRPPGRSPAEEPGQWEWHPW